MVDCSDSACTIHTQLQNCESQFFPQLLKIALNLVANIKFKKNIYMVYVAHGYGYL